MATKTVRVWNFKYSVDTKIYKNLLKQVFVDVVIDLSQQQQQQIKSSSGDDHDDDGNEVDNDSNIQLFVI